MTLHHFTIAEIQRALHDGELSAREIACQTLDDIARVNPQINAWTEVTAQRMLAEADSIDALRREKRPLPPLAGIPYAVKNLFDVAGHTTLAGAELLSGRPPAASDSWAVRQLHSAGALLSGMLNMDAYAYGFTTENSHYGATRNPHDLTRIAGGSSGGSAAAVAAGLVHFSLGTDTNGSIRVPASLCGIYGLKPTFGRLSRSGSHPFVASLDHIGPFARRVCDLASVYDALQGRDTSDGFQAESSREQTRPLLDLGLDGLRCAVLGGYFTTWCDADARDAVARVAKALDVQDELQFPDAELARSAAFIISASEGGNQYLPALRREPERFEPHSRERLLAGAMIPSAWYIQAQRFRAQARQAFHALFARADVLIAPATPRSATRIGEQTMEINGQPLPIRASMGMLTQPISFLGLPVCCVPVWPSIGEGSMPVMDGALPVGVQVIAAPWREDRVLRVAAELEAAGVVSAPVAALDIPA